MLCHNHSTIPHACASARLSRVRVGWGVSASRLLCRGSLAISCGCANGLCCAAIVPFDRHELAVYAYQLELALALTVRKAPGISARVCYTVRNLVGQACACFRPGFGCARQLPIVMCSGTCLCAGSCWQVAHTLCPTYHCACFPRRRVAQGIEHACVACFAIVRTSVFLAVQRACAVGFGALCFVFASLLSCCLRRRTHTGSPCVVDGRISCAACACRRVRACMGVCLCAGARVCICFCL